MRSSRANRYPVLGSEGPCRRRVCNSCPLLQSNPTGRHLPFVEQGGREARARHLFLTNRRDAHQASLSPCWLRGLVPGIFSTSSTVMGRLPFSLRKVPQLEVLSRTRKPCASKKATCCVFIGNDSQINKHSFILNSSPSAEAWSATMCAAFDRYHAFRNFDGPQGGLSVFNTRTQIKVTAQEPLTGACQAWH